MDGPQSQNSETLSQSALKQIDELCDRFEAALKAGERPSIERDLESRNRQVQRLLLRELVSLEIAYRRKQGEELDVEEYRERFSEYSGVLDEVLARVSAYPRSQTRQVGPYKTLDVLGEGGMGVVYLAEQREPVRRRVALKLIKVETDNEVIARFEAERQALALMNHPHIARVFDVGATEDSRPYFAMELVEGLPITDYCDRHKLGIRARIELFQQVCQGVEHAHYKDVIHRDLKPTNLLVATSDDEPVVKIIDFGVARATNQRLTEKTLYTEVGRVIGTPAYMSPEQADPTVERLDHRADIYSLGAILYELLVGVLPLEVDLRSISLDELIRRVREDEPACPSVRWSRLNLERTTRLSEKRRTTSASLYDELHGDLDWICMKALEKEPARRYATAAHFREDLERYLAEEPVAARPPSVTYRLKKFVWRNRSLMAAVGAVLLTLAVGVATNVWLALDSRRSEVLANQRARENLIPADRLRLAEYRTEAVDLWPSAGDVMRVKEWLRKAEALAGRLDRHRRELEAMGGSVPEVPAARTDPTEPGSRQDAGTADLEKRHAILSVLVDDLERFADPENGILATVRKRLEWMPSLEVFQKSWGEATSSIANDPAYKGVGRIEVMKDLLPLGPDPVSKLWEFAHLRTGRPPTRGDGGRLEVTKDTALILVLLPPGELMAGKVTLSAFLISKYKVTQEQWRNVMGESPARQKPNREEPTVPLPVNGVSWWDSKEFCGRAGLDLPSEARWLYAYRTNKIGLRDMESPFWEWCQDTHVDGVLSGQDPVFTSGGIFRVLRGGHGRMWIYPDWTGPSGNLTTLRPIKPIVVR